MSKKIKSPKPNVGNLIVPHTSDNITPKQQRPIFSFYKIRRRHCVSKCTKDEKEALIDKIYRISQLTWAEIRRAPKHGLGFEHIETSTLKVEIPNEIKGEVKFIAFRFHDKAPMIGYRERRTFHIIWVDRDFTVYDH